MRREQVKAAEDLLVLTRSLKEAWLFGRLQTLGKSEAEQRTEGHARAVGEMMQKLIKELDEKTSVQPVSSN